MNTSWFGRVLAALVLTCCAAGVLVGAGAPSAKSTTEQAQPFDGPYTDAVNASAPLSHLCSGTSVKRRDVHASGGAQAPAMPGPSINFRGASQDQSPNYIGDG